MFIKSKPARKKQKIIFILLATIFTLSFFAYPVAALGAGFELKFYRDNDLSKPVNTSTESLKLFTRYMVVLRYNGSVPASICPAPVATSIPSACPALLVPTAITFNSTSRFSSGGSTQSTIFASDGSTFCNALCSPLQNNWDVSSRHDIFFLPPEDIKTYFNPVLQIWTENAYTNQNHYYPTGGSGRTFIGFISWQSPYLSLTDQFNNGLFTGIGGANVIVVENKDQTIDPSGLLEIKDRDHQMALLKSIQVSLPTFKIAQTTPPAKKPLEDPSILYTSGSTDGGSSTTTKPETSSGGSSNPSGSTAAATAAGNDIFFQLIDILQKLIIAAAFLMFILAIFTYVGSGGDSKKVGKAKEYLVSAITALVALVLAQWFLKFK